MKKVQFATGLFVFLVVCLSFTSCNFFSGEESCINIKINSKNISFDSPVSLNMDSYVDSVKFVKLETTEKNQLSTITELFFTKEWIIVLDASSSSIHFFDYAGNYSHTVSKRGGGPGEYTRISRLIVDVEKELLMVYDVNQRKLIKFDFNGNYIHSINTFSNGALIRDLIQLPDGRFICYRQDAESSSSEYGGGLWIVSKDGSYEKNIYPITTNYPFRFSEYWYHLYHLPNGEIGFVDQNQTSIYVIRDDSVSKRVSFTLPGKTAADFIGNERVDEGFFMIMSSQEKGGFIFTDWSSDKGYGFVTVVSKKDGKMESGASFDPLMKGYFIPGGRPVRNNSLSIHTSWFLPSHLKPHLDEKAPVSIREAAKTILSGMSEQEIDESNPIIQLLYIKE